MSPASKWARNWQVLTAALIGPSCDVDTLREESGPSEAEAVLTPCIAQGDRHHEAALRTNLADRLRASADLDAAIARLTSAAGIGAVAGELQPEIWQRTEWRWWCSMSRLAPGSVPWAIAERPLIARYARSPWFMREEVE
jgi:hypothetical protein